VSRCPSAFHSAEIASQSTPLAPTRSRGTTPRPPPSRRRTRSLPKYAAPSGRSSHASAKRAIVRRVARIHQPTLRSGQPGSCPPSVRRPEPAGNARSQSNTGAAASASGCSTHTSSSVGCPFGAALPFDTLVSTVTALPLAPGASTVPGASAPAGAAVASCTAPNPSCVSDAAAERTQPRSGVYSNSTAPSAAGPPGSQACAPRSEEHTSELQSLTNLVCRLLLEQKKKITTTHMHLLH